MFAMRDYEDERSCGLCGGFCLSDDGVCESGSRDAGPPPFLEQQRQTDGDGGEKSFHAWGTAGGCRVGTLGDVDGNVWVGTLEARRGYLGG